MKEKTADEINIAFSKFITHKNKNVFKLVKTKTNKYYLVECCTNKIVATNKRNILLKIKEWGEGNL